MKTYVARIGSARRFWLLAIATLANPATAPAQSVVSALGNWSFQTTQGPTLNPADTVAHNQSSRLYSYVNPASNAYAVGQAFNQGILAENSPTQSLMNWTVTGRQTFSINTASVVQFPRYFMGTIGVSGAGAVNASGSASFVVGVRNAADTAWVVAPQPALTLATSNQSASIDTADLLTANLPAGSYILRSELAINAQTFLQAASAGGASSPGQTINVSFGTLGNIPGRQGGATVLSAWAQGLDDSRAAVGAAAGRARGNVDGSGVIVGMLETGRPYIATDQRGVHSDLAAPGKITLTHNQLPLATLASQTEFRREHAQAVASIIAGDNADPSRAGIAPKAKIVSAAYGAYSGGTRFQDGINDLIAANAKVINISFGGNVDAAPGPDAWSNFLDSKMIADPDLMVVTAAGNTGAQPDSPGINYNGIAVGSLNRDFTTRAAYSAFGPFTTYTPYRFKPDLVAPGEQILSASAFSNVATRGFAGETYDSAGSLGPQAGEISGTSFATPMVSGAVALLHEMVDDDPLGHDRDRRVLKAVLMNSATRTGITRIGGAAWSQGTSGALTTADPRLVLESVDRELGAGSLNVDRAIQQFQPDELELGAADMGATNNIDATQKQIWWDKGTVGTSAADANGVRGTVSYLLGAVSGELKATLAWDALANGTIPNLELRLYVDTGADGYDAADQFIARTLSQVDFAGTPGSSNVGIFDFLIPNQPPIPQITNYYLAVANLSGDATTYGLAVLIPEPGTVGLIAVAFFVMVRRNRPTRGCDNRAVLQRA